MFNRFCVALAFVCSSALAVTPAVAEEAVAEEAKAEERPNDTLIEKLQGRWEIVAGVNQGRTLADFEVEGTYVTISINRIVSYDRDDQQRFRAVYRIDSSTDPVQITMTSVPKLARPSKIDPPPKPETAVAEGIIRFDNAHRWTLCYALEGADRPTEFKSPRGSKNMLLTLERKPGDPVPDVLTTNETN
ncbi:TIGR03067 domain-containing protein [Stieleria sp. ICT_E10.1]|uniref:TIGR03067 domain-containing protein n=1 Tax=Stieleria sedimenti TaxID=2976331 RepID=UPI0021802A16|nr:TIGR03067 domain-containing protein [Stieleria sedimenti]MCS7470289.1 TIGR03067 domain-containing protein [Stieleria sedimenti]